MIHTLGRNWQWKITCLLVAVVLWFVVINEQNPTSEGSYTVPVAVQNLDSKYIASDVPKNIYVRLSGPRNTIVNTGANDIKAYVDLKDVEEGETNVPIHVEIPQGMELKKQSAKTADIRIDLYAVQEFTLKTHLAGKIEDGISVSGIKLTPEKVIVSGANRLVKMIDRVVVDVPMAGKDKDFSMLVPIRLLQKDGTPVEGLQITPKQTNIKVTILRNAVTKKVPVNLMTYGVTDDKVKLKQIMMMPKEVEVRGTADSISTINSISLPTLDIDGMEKTREWLLPVPAMDGIVIEPDIIKVRVEVE